MQYARRQGTLIPLPTWGRVSFDYLQCFAAVLFFEKKVGTDRMLAVVRRTLQGESFERALDQEIRWSLTDLEREFVAWVDHLWGDGGGVRSGPCHRDSWRPGQAASRASGHTRIAFEIRTCARRPSAQSL
jgi:hypothetical protein